MKCEDCSSTLRLEDSKTLHLEQEYADKGLIGNARTSQDSFIFSCASCNSERTRMKFFSITLKPGGASEKDAVLPFCYDEGIIAIGWEAAKKNIKTRDDYLSYRLDKKGEQGRVKREIKDFTLWVRPDDILFAYHKPTSEYYMIQVAGDWQYRPNAKLSAEKRKKYEQHGIWQFYEANWQKVPRKYLDGDVLAGTPPPATIQKRQNVGWSQAEYYALLREEHDIDEEVEITELQDRMRSIGFGPEGSPSEVLNLLAWNELETIVINYVQRQTGAVLLQNTTDDDFPDIESLLRSSRDDGRPRTIGVQVTRGSVNNRGDLENFLQNADDLFVYCKGHSEVKGAVDLTDREILSYMCYHTPELPPSALLRLSSLGE